MSFAVSVHILAAVLWVGGMFFAHQVLRPTAVEQLEPPRRLPLWKGCFERFFPWVWAAVLLLPTTGYWIIFAVYGGMGGTPLQVHLMNGTGSVMIALFLYLYFFPYRLLRHAVANERWKSGARHLTTIRRIVGTNLLLGLATVVIASGGRYL